jgi:SAM-dependent methyltransferase
MWQKDSTETRNRYRTRWLQYGYDPRTLGWNKDCQWVRFEAAFESFQNSSFKSVLDIGCGFGDLLTYLRQRGWTGRYLGVDLVQELIDEASRLHASDPAAEFVCADIAEFTADLPYDVAVAIGVFNHRLEQGNTEFIERTVNKMWSGAVHAVVCDFLSLSSDPERRQPNLFYADPRAIYEMAARYSRRVMIHHAYMPFEFQLKIWRDDTFSVLEPVFSDYAGLAKRQTEICGRDAGRGKSDDR